MGKATQLPPQATTSSLINARTVLWYLAFVGFAVNYMLRININITIVDMVQQRANVRVNNVTECVNEYAEKKKIDNATRLPEGWNVTIKRGYSVERSWLCHRGIEYDEQGFVWNERQQGLILGSFYWMHWATQIPGGILARKYGTKLVFGLSNLIGCGISSLMPIASYWDYRVLIFIRVVQGLICGLAWPAMHNMTGQWIPPNERSKFVTAYLGSSVGVALCFPLFGYIISWSSWEWVFHACTIIGVVWYIGWYYLVFDTPAKHPRIDPEEREYIEKTLGTSVQKNLTEKTPWKAILSDCAVWMTVVAQWGGIWGLFTQVTQAPTYFKYIHGWGIKMTGLLSGLPHIMRMLFALLFSCFGDYMLRTDKLSRTAVRKLAGATCCIVNGLFILALAYTDCNAMAAVVLLTLATAMHGAVSTGPLANIVDLSPNYAGIVLGLSGMIGVLPGFISPIIVGILTFENQTIHQWKIVFLITAGMLIGSGILYISFGDSNLKTWNDAATSKAVAELEALHPKTIELKSNIVTKLSSDDENIDEGDGPKI